MNDTITAQDVDLSHLKFVHLSRSEWLDWHYSPEKVSASEVAAILGIDSWSSPLRRYHLKKGQIPRPDETRAMRLGHALEPIIAGEYTRETGYLTADPGDFTVCVHPDLSGLFCTLDRVALIGADEAALELKSTGSYSKKEWEIAPPLKYQVQNQMQMACSGLDLGVLAVLVGNQHFFHHEFMKHDELIENTLKKIDAFLDRLKRGDPPDPTGHEDDNDLYKYLHPKDNGRTINAEGMVGVIRDRTRIKKEMKELKKKLDTAEQTLKQAIGDNTALSALDFTVTFKHQSWKDTVGVDLDQVEAMKEAGIEFKVNPGAEFRKLHLKK